MKPNLPDRVERCLSHRHFFKAVLILALALSAPTIAIGFYSDDYVFLCYLEKLIPGSPPWYDLYNFFNGDPQETQARIGLSGIPWWTDPELKLHLVRPLTSALLTLERALFGHAPVGYHLVSIALYVALVAAAGRLFLRVLPGATGALALLLFAVNANHMMSVGWIACQHLLLAALPVVLGLLAHLRYREEGWRPGRYLGPLALGIGLLGGEAALGGAAYWLAYQLAGPVPPGRAAGWRARAAGALPALGLLAYFAAYKAVGGGAANTGAYIDPLSSPLRFAAVAAERLPVLLGNAIASVPADLSSALPKGPFIVIGLAATAGLALLYCACLPAIPERERAALRWLVPGALLAVLTSLGGFPGSRLLLVPDLGIAPLLAVIILSGLRRGPSPGLVSSGRRGGAGFLGIVHIALAPVVFLAATASSVDIARKLEEVARTAEIGAPPRKRVFLAASSDPMASIYPQAILALESPEVLSCWSMLSMTKASHRLTRTGPSSFTLAPIGRTMLTGAFELLYRAPSAPLQRGDQVVQCGATIRVAEVEDGRPSQIEVELGAPLEDPALVLLAWRDGKLRRVALPAVGETVELPWSPGPIGLL
ncbi:hypothetical protein WME89_26265 [Sorangium sp. So ce321]|uniref:hypothetical protein n=1 Tax=Sorangium sp. So ce321 TaxID=3133300 RepID=UPI003F638890